MPRPKPPVYKIGRPSRYRAEFVEQARKLCMLGYTDKRLADFFGVTEMTVNRWKIDHPDFGVAIREGKVGSDMDVVSALKHRALGYSHPEVDIKVVNGEIVKTELVKHYPPDTGALQFWLINRHPDLWKSKRETEGDDEGEAPVPVKVVVEVKDARKPE